MIWVNFLKKISHLTDFNCSAFQVECNFGKPQRFFLYHLSGKILLGEEEGLEDDPETRSDVSAASFAGS